MISNIIMNLIQHEWIKNELKWITYESRKFLELFLYEKSFSIFNYLIYLISRSRAQILENSGS
jgi:hypothetical protein